jgi:hypothetical protein
MRHMRAQAVCVRVHCGQVDVSSVRDESSPACPSFTSPTVYHLSALICVVYTNYLPTTYCSAVRHLRKNRPVCGAIIIGVHSMRPTMSVQNMRGACHMDAYSNTRTLRARAHRVAHSVCVPFCVHVLQFYCAHYCTTNVCYTRIPQMCV